MIIAAVVRLMILPCSVVAAKWNGLRFVRIVPGEVYGDTVGLKGTKTGAYARGEFYEKKLDRSYKFMPDVALQNSVAPMDVLLSNREYLLTFDKGGRGAVGSEPADVRNNQGCPFENLERVQPNETLSGRRAMSQDGLVVMDDVMIEEKESRCKG